MKLTALAVFGAGYVLGTRAGRERYDQLVALGARLADRLEASADATGSPRTTSLLGSSEWANGLGTERTRTGSS